MTYTRHGHPIEGSPVTPKPEFVTRCGGPNLCLFCREDVSAFMAKEKERRQTLSRLAEGSPTDRIAVAKQTVVEYWNSTQASSDMTQKVVYEDDVFIVWFAYVLGGWKALISSDAWIDTSYFEVIYNNEKDEVYLDHYRKVSNTAYPNHSGLKLKK